MAHRGQSRALFLCRRGRIQSYTPSAYSLQNTTLPHAASTGWIVARWNCWPVHPCVQTQRKRSCSTTEPAKNTSAGKFRRRCFLYPDNVVHHLRMSLVMNIPSSMNLPPLRINSAVFLCSDVGFSTASGSDSGVPKMRKTESLVSPTI